MLGIVGAPAAGKSTVAEALVAALGERAALLPMDGFHLSNVQLARLARAQRKGAPDTFDGAGYRALLARIRDARETVYAPMFRREIEEPIAAGLHVPPQAALVITEGNYLLLDQPPWPDARALLDAVWSIAIPAAEREARLLARHVAFGRSEAQAQQWIAQTDRPNAERIDARAMAADRYLTWQGTRIVFASG